MNAHVFLPNPTAYYKADEVDAYVRQERLASRLMGMDDQDEVYKGEKAAYRAEIKRLNGEIDRAMASADVIAGQRDALREIVSEYKTEGCACDSAYDQCSLCSRASAILESLKPKTEAAK